MEHGWTRCGKYELCGEISRGGSGVVYKARDPDLDRYVALKVLDGHRLADPRQAERFQRESRLAAMLDHEGIVKVFDAGVHDQRPYLVMSLVDGEPLDVIMARRRPAFREAAEIAAHLARILAHAHRQGIIHRDVKPSNILIRPDGRPVLADFGIAKFLSEASPLTQTGELIGTPQYMAPEQIQGDAARCDARADVYALGAVLYELITGAPPYAGSTFMEVSVQILNDDPVPPVQQVPACHPDLSAICMKALQREPSRRFQTAEEFADELERFQRGEQVRTRPEHPLKRTWRRRRWAILGLMALALVAGVSIVMVLDSRQQVQVNTWIKEGAKHRLDGHPDKARGTYERVLEVDPGNKEALGGIVDAYLDEAEAALGRNDLAGAEKAYATVLKLKKSRKTNRMKDLELGLDRLRAASQ